MKEENGYKYLEYGPDSEYTLLLLHGLMGELSNFDGIIEGFQDEYKIYVPQLPLFSIPLRKLSVSGLMNYINDFVEYMDLKNIIVLGNSLGGHLAQLFTLENPDRVKAMVLTGSSGLFESAMGNSFPKRGSYEYIKKKAEDVFYDPRHATKELVDAVYQDVNDRSRAIRIIKTAKSAIRHNLGDKLKDINKPALLIWGKQDGVTPPFVAEKFHELLPQSDLYFIDKCGHAPMMERPDEFNKLLKSFLDNL